MKKIFLCFLFIASAGLCCFAQETAAVQARPTLSLDFPVFNLPYQSDAAQSLQYGFFDSFLHPSMSQVTALSTDAFSALHFGMQYLYSALDVGNKTRGSWQRWVYHISHLASDALLFMLPAPPSFVWMHESFHRAVSTHTGYRSHIEYHFPTSAVTMTDSGTYKNWLDMPRAAEAGLESEVLFLEQVQRDNF
jgi:hypothetical protein